MTGALSEQEQVMLRDSVHAFLTTRSDPTWASLVGDLELDEALLDPRQAAIVAEEIGRTRTVQPFTETATAHWLTMRCGGSGPNSSAIATVAWAEPGMRYDMADIAATAYRDGEGWRIRGTKAVVGWAPLCDHLIIAARTAGRAGDREGLSLFRIDPAASADVETHPYRTIDDRPAADLMFHGQFVAADALIGPLDGAIDCIEEARDRAMAMLAAEAVGLLDRLLEQSIAYTGQRRQFGLPLASFQALQHRMVDMYLECELACSAAWLAIEALDEVAPTRGRAVSNAMVNIARAGRFVGQQAIQLHGGMGMTDELPVGHYVKRLMAIEVEWADTDWHLARIAGL
jgi:alkylation response protein AidB-like acyl-CoA dehydrogenase